MWSSKDQLGPMLSSCGVAYVPKRQWEALDEFLSRSQESNTRSLAIMQLLDGGLLIFLAEVASSPYVRLSHNDVAAIFPSRDGTSGSVWNSPVSPPLFESHSVHDGPG